MSDRRNDLLLAALKRAGVPCDSGDLLDRASGLALAERWAPEQLAPLTRASVAKRLTAMEGQGLVKKAGAGVDPRARRPTPMYVPDGGWDDSAPVPPPPTDGRASAARGDAGTELDDTQFRVLLDAHDELFGLFARHVQQLGTFMGELSTLREKHRARLAAVGLRSNA